MGVGPDGHTASLFREPPPRMTGIDLFLPCHRREQRVARITLTYRMLAWGGERLFLVTGADKRPLLQKVLSGEGDLPSQWVLREAGALGHPSTFLIDASVAPTR
jgi:6-phosphogluconolactonase/Glucosamine-6-phosphate isomerase/deaminase